MLTQQQVTDFQQAVLDYYYQNQRDLPWRQPEPDGTFDPYKIMVSEVMLQQTQVLRVIEKYRQFLIAFPTIQRLAQANLTEILTVWQGLGYNRRARFMRETALRVCNDYEAIMPQTVDELTSLPGIGHNTASAILVYAHNQPQIFIETNIRTVYLHHFFPDGQAIDDKQVIKLVAQTLESENPRDWYWALMDYGTYLKKQHGNPNNRSKQYLKQSSFSGSRRQLRGKILHELTMQAQPLETLSRRFDDSRFIEVVDSLIYERLIVNNTGVLQIAD